MLRTLGRLRNLFEGAVAVLRRKDMDAAHFATLGDRPFVGCQPCAPDPQGIAPEPLENEPAAMAPRQGND